MTTEYLNNKYFEDLIFQFQTAKKEKNRYEVFINDIKDTEIRTSKRGKYKKPELWIEIEKKYQIINSDFQEIQTRLAVEFLTLSQNIVGYAKFNLIDHDDAIQEGVMICFEKVDRFDPARGKAFNYMSTCIFNSLKQLFRTARNYSELKRKYLDFISLQQSHEIPAKVKTIYKNN
jgi:DNA-directed RNA polymerase specialized sigma subunit